MITYQRIAVDVELSADVWSGEKTPFILVHGLASNRYTWRGLAEYLTNAGHFVVAYDQRGHGQSEKPDDGYDFATVTHDLYQLIQSLDLKQPIVVGQSWGGNVGLEFAARYPHVAGGLGLIDGGFIHLQARPDGDWETIAERLKPPSLLGTPSQVLRRRLENEHPDWTELGIEGAMACFETLPDGSVRPWLTLERHMKILRALWEQDPAVLYPQVQEPVLVCPADQRQSPPDPVWAGMVAAAGQGLKRCEVRWFYDTDHDIHMHRPKELAQLFLDFLNDRLWG